MTKRNQKRPDRTGAKKQTRSNRWRTYSLMLVCGLMLVSGFFFAGRQHFSSMDYGMKNSRLRKQIDALESEKRRLLLAREVSLSPAEIKKAVKKTGMIDPAAAAGEMAQVASTTKEKAVPDNPAQMKPMVIKTASVTLVERPADDAYPKTAKVIKPSKPAPPAKITRAAE